MAQVATTTRAAVCIFAKPPVAGAVKTRLIPVVGAERAAELAEAFLQDTLAVVRKFGRPVVEHQIAFTIEKVVC
jgi:glycosyltransferase A (GT-A) superfamily protein (DUF2064 family)